MIIDILMGICAIIIYPLIMVALILFVAAAIYILTWIMICIFDAILKEWDE